MKRLSLSILLLGLGAGVCLPDAQSYFNAKRTIKACVLTLNSIGYENPDPHVFYIAEMRKDLKPYGWEFVNPLATPYVTQGQVNLWSGRGPVADFSKEFYAGAPMKKSFGAYWEVQLDRVELSDLLQFDVIFVTNHFASTFSDEEREKLRKLVDMGGILWLDDCGGFRIKDRPSKDGGAGSFFIEDLNFWGTQGGTGGGRRTEVAAGQAQHPLITTPYYLSDVELQRLGDKNVGNYWMHGRAGTSTPPDRIITPVLINSESGLPNMAVAQYGSGYVILTSVDEGCGINDPVQGRDGKYRWRGGANSAPVCAPGIHLAQSEDLKFLYNMISWSFGVTSARKNARRVGGSYEDIAPPPVKENWPDPLKDPTGYDQYIRTPLFTPKWQYQLPQSNYVTSQPVLSKGVVFVGTSDGYLRAFDGIPNRDLDYNGVQDDGLPDYSSGQPYDLIWEFNAGLPMSAPQLVSIQGQEFILVTTQDSRLMLFPAFPVDAAGDLQGNNPPAQVWDVGQNPGDRYDPTPIDVARVPSACVHEGYAYIAGPTGPINVINLSLPADHIKIQGTENLGNVTAPVTVGYVRDENSGAIDKVLYVGTVTDISGQSGVFKAFPLNVRGERLTQDAVQQRLFLARYHRSQWRWNTTNGSLTVWKKRADGTIVKLREGTDYRPDGGSEYRGRIRLDQGVTLDPGDTFYADFDIDLTAPVPARTEIQLKSNQPPPGDTRGVAGPIALGPEDIVYFGATNGVVYGIKDRYTLVRNAGGTYDKAQPVTVLRWREASNTDPYVGAPAVSGDLMYIATKRRLYALNANPTLVITPKNPITNPNTVVVQQQDSGFPSPIVIDRSQYDVNSSGQIVFKTLSGPTSGGAGAHLPYITTDSKLLISYDYAGGRVIKEEQPEISPLDPGDYWYQTLVWTADLESDATGGAMVMGGWVYVPLDNGRVWAYAADPRRMDSNFGSNGNIDNFYKKIASSEIALSGSPGTQLAGANGLLAVNAGNFLYCYDGTPTVVADANRVVEVTGGQAVWTVQATKKLTVDGGELPVYDGSGNVMNPPATGVTVERVQMLNRPRAVRKVNGSDYMVADSGNNRVVQFDRAGNVIWELTKFTDPVVNGKTVLEPGDPLTLNNPRDFQVWNDVEENGLYHTHFLIADTGNFRVLEILVEFDRNGNQVGEPTVIWASQTAKSGKRFAYATAQRITITFDGGKTYIPFTVCSVVNTRYAVDAGVKPPLSQEEGGGVAVLGKDGKLAFSTSELEESPGGRVVKMMAPVSVGLYRQSGDPLRDRWVIADRDMVYLVQPNLLTGRLTILWRYPNATVGKEFKLSNVTCAKALPNGNILITDIGDYTVTLNGEDFQTAIRVFEVNPNDDTAPPVPISMSGLVSGTHPLTQPVYADRGN